VKAPQSRDAGQLESKGTPVMASHPHNKSIQVSRAKQLIAGANKHFPNGNDTLAFGGESTTVSAFVAKVQTFVDLRDAVNAAKAAAKAKLEEERAQSAALLVALAAFAAFVRARFGNAPDVLADFGLSPRKVRAPMTAESKAVAVVKRGATRTARHTMGSRQKKGVKGKVTATLVVTPEAASPPTPTPPSASPPRVQ
jgi:hypothetical protein